MTSAATPKILARASNEPELFGILFDRHFATIHRYLERRVGREGADELAAEVFRIAFEQRARFRPLHESALPWLYGLATNLMLKRWRGERRHLRALARARTSGATCMTPSTRPTRGSRRRRWRQAARRARLAPRARPRRPRPRRLGGALLRGDRRRARHPRRHRSVPPQPRAAVAPRTSDRHRE